MTDARLVRKQELLAALALAPTEDRPQLLTVRCGDDPELQAEVEALLPYLGAPTPSPAGDLEAALEEKLAERFVGKAFGPYTVHRLLGRGGFSRVFLATRSFEGQERTYAVKVPLGGSFAEEAARYRLEIAVLSQLRHPNIAGLVDVVPGPDDRPLLVMDYVEGAQPITLAAAGSAIPTRRRIELFLKVLSALSAAHERGVIHCDLSAANVVLRSDGEPLIIDFGIAKVSWERAGTVTVGPRPLTYEYASPEQYRGEPLSVRTDIYSAGVLLYELLAGVLPYDIDRRSPEACRKTVCDLPVERASQRAARAPGQSPEQARSAARQLRGDLDAILGKALEKDPARRYESANAFAEDLRAHLELRPVVAKAPGAVDRSFRWARRHPAISATAALALVLSVGFGTFHVVRLRREEARATKIAEAFRDVLRGFDPAAVSKNPITVKDLLDQATEKATSQLKDEPLVRGTVLETLGTTYSSLGDLDRAEKLLREAVSLQKNGPPAERSDSLNDLATVLIRRSKLTEAEPLLREAVALRRQASGPKAAEVAVPLNNLVVVRQGLGDFREASTILDEVLAIQQATDPKGFGILRTRNQLANLLIAGGGAYDRALGLHSQNVTDIRAMLGPEHPFVALALNNLAHAEDETGRHSDAQKHYAEALALGRKIYGGPHPEVALVLNNLSVSEAATRSLDAAEGHAREALAMRRQLLGQDHADTAVTLRNLAHVVHLRGRLEEAEQLFRDALGSTRKASGEDHPDVAIVLAHLGNLRRERGDLAESERLLSEAVKRDRAAYTGPNLHLLKNLGSLAATEEQLGKFPEAEALAREALGGIKKAGLPPDHETAGEMTVLLATVLERSGRLGEARDVVRAGIATFQKNPSVVERLRAVEAAGTSG